MAILILEGRNAIIFVSPKELRDYCDYLIENDIKEI